METVIWELSRNYTYVLERCERETQMHYINCSRLLRGAALTILLTVFPGAASGAPSDGNSGGLIASARYPADTARRKVAEVDRAQSRTREAAPIDTDAVIPGRPEVGAPEPTRNASDSQATDISASDQSVAEELRQLVERRLDRYVDRKNEQSAIQSFYASRNFLPIWVQKGVATAAAKTAIARIKAADQDALEPSDYPTPDLTADTSSAGLAEAELKLTGAVLAYARDAQMGPIHFTRVSENIYYEQETPDPTQILANVMKATDVAAALDSYNPPQAGYKALKAKLAELRAARSGSTDDSNVRRIPEGPSLRIGDTSPRVTMLRERLTMPSAVNSGERYDKALAVAVRNFQTENGLTPDGVVGPNTLAVLNGKAPFGRAEDLIVVNMLRWRWMPRKLGEPSLGDAYVMLNIPDFTLNVVRSGKTVWHTKVVTGKPSNQTPLLTETMKYITVNPSWNVPSSIIYNEYIPALRQDPTAMSRMGIEVSQKPDGSVYMVQPPGDNNALGRLRFNFPNKFLVYQHDTPDKYLFQRTVRAYSHGCMRVQHPLKYAEILLSIVQPNEKYTPERLRRMYGPTEKNIRFPTAIPVHLTYQTAFVDDSGTLQLRGDAYGHDKRMLAIIKSDDERRVADLPISRPGHSHSRPPVDLPYGVVKSGPNDRYDDGPSFFDLFRSDLFGGPARRVREGYNRIR